MRPVLVDENRETGRDPRQPLREDGRLHVDHLQRFGIDLLDVSELPPGARHRPSRHQAGQHRRGDSRPERYAHLMLFDFSLAERPTRTSGWYHRLSRPAAYRAKTPSLDLHAERYAAAATLRELRDRNPAAMGRRCHGPQSHLTL